MPLANLLDWDAGYYVAGAGRATSTVVAESALAAHFTSAISRRALHSAFLDADNSVSCATEGGQCLCDGMVRYGREKTFFGKHGAWSAWRSVNGSISCNNSTFGDPLPWTHKECVCNATPAEVKVGTKLLGAAAEGDETSTTEKSAGMGDVNTNQEDGHGKSEDHADKQDKAEHDHHDENRDSAAKQPKEHKDKQHAIGETKESKEDGGETKDQTDKGVEETLESKAKKASNMVDKVKSESEATQEKSGL